jgi:hypothetical protein
MKYLKSLLLVCGLFALNTRAEFYATNNLAASNHIIFSAGGKVLQSITLWSTNVAPTLVYLRDGTLVTTNGVFTNYVRYTTNVITSDVSAFTGLTNTFTNTVIQYTAVVTAANTNVAVLPRYTFVVPSTPTVFNFDFDPQPMFVNPTTTLSNSLTGLNVLLEYRTP